MGSWILGAGGGAVLVVEEDGYMNGSMGGCVGG